MKKVLFGAAIALLFMLAILGSFQIDSQDKRFNEWFEKLQTIGNVYRVGYGDSVTLVMEDKREFTFTFPEKEGK